MRRIFCDKCGKEIHKPTDIKIVFGHELCPECVIAVDNFIISSPSTPTMDELRDFCNNFGKDCSECPFYDEDLWDECSLKEEPHNWSSEEEILSKLLDYIIKHPDWRKEEKQNEQN